MDGDMIIIDVLYFLNQINLSDKLDNGQLDKIKQIKENNCKRI